MGQLRSAEREFTVDGFVLPEELEARSPAEERGSGRDDVRLLVGRRDGLAVEHRAFRELPRALRPGDVLVVNDSETLPAALDGRVAGTGEPVVVHFSTRGEGLGEWVVELRSPGAGGTTVRRTEAVTPGTVVEVAGGASLTVRQNIDGGGRLWRSSFSAVDGVAYLRRHGRAIRYGYTDADRPIEAYQTVFAEAASRVRGGPARAGSAEMPSAARPFTERTVAELVGAGVQFAPLTLHTGVASAEAGEPPYAEWFSVPESSARLVNAARAAGGRVVAVGTTAVRALESAVTAEGLVRAAEGWTELVITPSRGVLAVDGLLTGLHEPRASHLLMLEAIAGRELLERCYREALRERYLWHEFGDVNLILPE